MTKFNLSHFKRFWRRSPHTLLFVYFSWIELFILLLALLGSGYILLHLFYATPANLPAFNQDTTHRLATSLLSTLDTWRQERERAYQTGMVSRLEQYFLVIVKETP